MLLLHSDVFLTTGQTVLQRAVSQLRAGPGLPQVSAAVLLHRDPFYQVAFTPCAREDFWDGGREGLWNGEERGKGAGGG